MNELFAALQDKNGFEGYFWMTDQVRHMRWDAKHRRKLPGEIDLVWHAFRCVSDAQLRFYRGPLSTANRKGAAKMYNLYIIE